MAIATAESMQLLHETPAVGVALVATLLLVVIATTTLLKRYSKRSNKKSPPSARGLPVIGNLHQLGSNAHRSLASMASRYGPLMWVRLGSARYLIVSSAAAATEALKTHDLTFSSRPYLTSSDRLFYGNRNVAMSPYGELWRQGRRVCVIHLLSAACLRQLSGAREKELRAMLDKIARRSKADAGGLVNISAALLDLTSSVISRSALGKSYWNETDEMATSTGGGARKLFTELTELLGALNIADFFPWLSWVNRLNGFEARAAKVAKGLDELLEQEIQDCLRLRKGSTGNSANVRGGTNFVDVLLSLETTADEYSLFDRDIIKAIILDMFGAGTHTTSTVMDRAMTELMRYPQVRAKLTQEIRSACNNELVGEDDIERMPYLRCVVMEVLRMYPPLPLLVPRETIDDVEIMGYHIPKGTKVMFNSCAIHRDPKQWDNPDEFRPERFVGSSVDYKGLDLELIPFGSGRRGCPGVLFATQLIYPAIANLLLNFDFDLPEGKVAADLDSSEAAGFTTKRQYSLVVRATPARS